MTVTDIIGGGGGGGGGQSNWPPVSPGWPPGKAQVYQREVVSAMAYLICSNDLYHQAIVKHQQWKAERHKFSLVGRPPTETGEE